MFKKLIPQRHLHINKIAKEHTEESTNSNLTLCLENNESLHIKVNIEKNPNREGENIGIKETQEKIENKSNSDDFYGSIYENLDPDKRDIEEEYSCLLFRLDWIFSKEYGREYYVDTDVNRCISKNLLYRSIGIRREKKPYMLIFTITKNFTLTCEIYLEFCEPKFIEYVDDLLRLTHHIYLIGICEENYEKFEEVWINLSVNFHINDNKINLKSIVFIPYKPKGILSHLFTQKIFDITIGKYKFIIC